METGPNLPSSSPVLTLVLMIVMAAMLIRLRGGRSNVTSATRSWSSVENQVISRRYP